MSILFRYLSKEVLSAFVAVTSILLAIFLCNQIIRYLGYAADGRLSTHAVLQLVAVALPYLLGLLLPLSLYISIMFAYGRLYADNEMTVLAACGVSEKQLVRFVLPIALFTTVLCAIFTLWLTPQIANYRNQLLAPADSAARLQTIFPGRFQELSGGKQVVYVEHLSKSRTKMEGVFMAERSAKGTTWDVLSAESGEQRVNKQTNELFIVTNNGYRYIGVPGQNDYQILQYQRYGVKLQSRIAGITTDSDALPTTLLLASYKLPKYAAELQWRISLPLMTLILVLLAVPLSQLTRGQGRYAKMLPAILIYILYVNMLFVGRNWVEQGSVSTLLGVWWIHLVALGLAGIFLFRKGRLR